MAKGLPRIDGWCGDRAVYFSRDSGIATDLIRLDVLTGKEAKLSFGLSTVLLGCSPDGRWVLTQSTVVKTRSSSSEDSEGGNRSCDVYADGHLDRIVLWDMKSGTRQVVGKGFMDVEWSLDGKLLLYSFQPHCNLESNPGNTFKLPPTIKEFKAVSVRAMIAKVLGANSGWPDKGRIGALNWYAPDAFVAQLPEADGMWLSNDTPAGVIVAVHELVGNATRIEQMNPSSFQPTWKLAIPQISSTDSDDILKAARCSVSVNFRQATSMGCDRLDQIGQVGFHPDLRRYCQTLNAGDIKQFCAPDPQKNTWWRMVRGSTVLLIKPNNDSKAGTSLFRIENDNGGYLK